MHDKQCKIDVCSVCIRALENRKRKNETANHRGVKSEFARCVRIKSEKSVELYMTLPYGTEYILGGVAFTR